MPIKLNLLAEAQIAEDARRRDPVKRAIYAGSFLVVLALVWSSSLQLKVVINNSELNELQAKIQSRTNEWQTVVNNQKKISDARAKLQALDKFSAARFLQGNLMNGLQQLNFDGVQLAGLKVSQTYLAEPGTASQPINGREGQGHPGKTTEKILIMLDARDVSASPGDKVNKFKEIVADEDYFKSILSKTNGVQLTSLSPLQTGTDGKSFELFSLECALPQQTR